MSLESDMYTYLTAQSGITNLIATRIYPNRLPDGVTLPAVVYQRITTRHELASGNVPLKRMRMQVDVWSDRYSEVDSVAEQIHTALDVTSATGIHASFPEDDEDSYDPDAQLHRRRMDFYLWRS